MALTKQTRKPFWHLLAGLAGLTGLAAVVVGLVVHYVVDEEVGLQVLAAGGALLLPAALLLLVGGVRLGLSRRGAVGGNVVLQVALAAALLVGANLFSFSHHKRWDLTWQGTFTIAPELREQLSRLRGETRIVMHLRHVTFGAVKAHERDAYNAAAERKVLQKVKDMVEQFEELGPRFKVEVLDVEEEGYKDRLEAVTKGSPALRAAIDRSAEDSIFFAAGDKVQSLSFAQVSQLDRKASLAAGGKGNLVLRPQGVEPFARRVLNIEEKRPRLAVAVFLQGFGLESDRPLINMAGLKKALTGHGWEGRDIILKKFNDTTRELEPAAQTYDDHRYEQLDEEVAEYEDLIKSQEQAVQLARQAAGERKKLYTEKSLEQWNRDAAVLDLGDEGFVVIARASRENARRRGMKVVDFAEEHRQGLLKELDAEVAAEQKRLEVLRQERDKTARALQGLNVDSLREQRRLTDVKAKLKRLLADCDLLIVPRFTMYNIPRREYIPPWPHNLDEDQTEAVKEFLKAGKPVLLCLGPASVDPADPRTQPPPEVKPDTLEPLLSQLGFRLPNQTVLYDAEARAQPERRQSFQFRQPEVIVPPVLFDWPAGAGRPSGAKEVVGLAHPLRTSLRLSLGGKGEDLRLRYPRPVYYDPPPGSKSQFDATFMMAAAESWNESNPFPAGKRVPRFEAPKPGDRDKGQLSERRRGPLPIAAAAEVKVPASWYADPEKAKDRPTVRVAVIGQGTLFSGESLSPAREKLLLDVSNWLLGREDFLSRDAQRWEYPRVPLEAQEVALWQWGTLLGLPLLFVYLGCAMWMVRRMR